MSSDHPLPLAPRDLLILAVLGEGPTHGYGIIKAVESRSESGVLLDPANLYRVLRRMNREGWIREEHGSGGEGPGPDSQPVGTTVPQCGDPRSVRAGVSAERPPEPGHGDSRRRTYAITPTGRSLLASELARLDRLLAQARPAHAGGEGS